VYLWLCLSALLLLEMSLDLKRLAWWLKKELGEEMSLLVVVGGSLVWPVSFGEGPVSCAGRSLLGTTSSRR
jgi:hypothetical protein